MIEIAFNDVKKNYGLKNVLDGVTFEINTGEVLAIVGKNGSGKTTLLKIITGEEKVDSGMVSIKNGSKVGFLEQIPKKVSDDVKVIEILSLGVKEIINLQSEMTKLELEMSKKENVDFLDNTLKKYSKVQEDFIAKGGYELREKISKICDGFKISEEKLEQKYNCLSGGEKTIVNLASVVLSNPDILLLDEPTNHLDIQTLEWFEGFLKSYNITVIIISHDRYFLDKVSTKTLLLENGKAIIYFGNYTYFLEEDERRLLIAFEDYKNQQKKIDAMKESIKKLREFGAIAGNEMFFKRAKSIEKRLAKLELLGNPKSGISTLPLNFNMKDRSGKDVLAIENLDVQFGNKKIFERANLKVKYGEKICLLGKNGSGKSTLIKTITGENNVFTGVVNLGSNVKIGYVPQEIYFENENSTILETFRPYFVGDETRLRATLARFMFRGENAFKTIGALSGGEKVRLKLAVLIQQDTNLLILDEPTNHIDIDTKEVLEEALKDYRGTVLFVSHDRYFINKLAERVIEIKDYKITSYLGNYDDYKMAKNRK